MKTIFPFTLPKISTEPIKEQLKKQAFVRNKLKKAQI